MFDTLKGLLGLALLIFLIINATTCESRRNNKRYVEDIYKAFEVQSTYYSNYVRPSNNPKEKLRHWGAASYLMYRELAKISDNKLSDRKLVGMKKLLQQKSFEFAITVNSYNPNAINAIYIINDIQPLALEIDRLQSSFDKYVNDKGY